MDSETIEKVLVAFENGKNEELSDLIIDSISDSNILERANIYIDKYEFWDKNKSLLIYHWCNELTDENIKNILNQLNKKNIEIIEGLGHKLSNEKYIDEIIKIGIKMPEVALEIWKNVSLEMLTTALKKEKNEVIKVLELDLDKISRIWNYLDKDSQSKLIDKVLINNRNKIKIIKDVWKGTDKELQQEKLIDILEHDAELLSIIWENTDLNVQITNLEKVLKVVKADDDLFENIWFSTCREAKEKNLDAVIDMVKSDSELLGEVWDDLDSKLRLKNFENVYSKLKQYDLEKYNKFIHNYIGQIESDKNNNPIIPQDLKNIIFNNKFLEQHYKNGSRLLDDLERNLPDIINKWDEIKRNIQYKKANSKINDDIEIRTNIEAIVSAYKAIEKIIPKTLPEIEFCNIPGAEKVGIITKYTSHPETARKRAFYIANRIESVGKLKKYPDFSIRQNNIELKVFSPNDKRPMLTGYNTDSCFIPNGNADNFGDNEYSLYQYCLTTPYGGVFECGKLDESDTLFSEVYMGTPFLVNGNCMAFHSYETDNGKESEIVNKLIVEAAKKAIENSNGNLNVVVITNLHTGEGSLDINDKFNLGTFFEVYTNDEYLEYEGLRKALNKPNYILAARVGDKILTGEELNNFCKETCNGDIELIKQKLNLQFGKINQDYEFHQNGAVLYKKEIKNSELVKMFYNEYDELRDEREILNLINCKMKLEKKKENKNLTSEENKILQECNKNISKLDEKIILKYLDLSQSEIKRRLEENLERAFQIYCGNDMKLIANFYGISNENLEKLVKEKAKHKAEQELWMNVETKESKNKEQKKETGKQKKEKSKLISEIKRKGNPKLNQLISKVQKNILTKKDFNKLEEAGISTKSYKESIEKSSNTADVEDRKKVKLEQRIRRYIKDDEFIKNVLISEIIEEPSEEMIKKEAIKKVVLTVRNSLSERVTEKIKQNRDVEKKGELEPYEIQKRDDEIRDRVLNLDNILLSISSGKEISKSERKLVDNLNYIYGIDIKKEYNKIIEEKNKLSNDIMRKQFEKMQSYITVGIEDKESINKIMGLIRKSEQQKTEYYNLTYGKNWYIAIDNSKIADVYMSNEAEEYEQEKMKETLKKMIEFETNEIARGILEQKYDELFSISTDSMDNCTEDVSIIEIQSEVDKIQRRIKYEKEKKENKNI